MQQLAGAQEEPECLGQQEPAGQERGERAAGWRRAIAVYHHCVTSP